MCPGRTACTSVERAAELAAAAAAAAAAAESAAATELAAELAAEPAELAAAAVAEIINIACRRRRLLPPRLVCNVVIHWATTIAT